jgi:uncharacterized repeat protein (TIGR01451 family)
MSNAYAGQASPPGIPGSNGEFPPGCFVNSFTQEFATTLKVTAEGQEIEPIIGTVEISDNEDNCGAFIDTTDFIYGDGAESDNSSACTGVFILPGEFIDCAEGSYSADFGDLTGSFWENEMVSDRTVFMPFSPVFDLETNSANTNLVQNSIFLDKSVDEDKVEVGDEVTYTYDVENTGDATLICTLVDDVEGTIFEDRSFASGEDDSIDIVVTINGDVTNEATLTCLDQLEDELEAEDSVTVTTFDPALSIDKTVDEDKVEVGDSVTYEYQAFNDGDGDLTNCSIVDDQIGLIAVGFYMADGSSIILYDETV